MIEPPPAIAEEPLLAVNEKSELPQAAVSNAPVVPAMQSTGEVTNEPKTQQ